MAFGTFFGVVIAVISLIYFWIRKKYSFFEQHGFLHEKPSFPFGNLRGVGSKYHLMDVVTRHYRKFKGKAPAFGIYFFTNANVVITDLEIVKNVLVRDFDVFHNRGLFYNEIDDPLTGHLFLLEDEPWRTMRAKLTPSFTSGKMKMMFETLLKVSNNMIDQLKSESDLDTFEMKDVLAKYTTDVIGNIAFGLEMNSIKDPDSLFRKMGRKIFTQDVNFQIKTFLFTSFRTLARKLHCKLIPNDVAEFFMGTIRETVEYRMKNNIERNDVMNLLIKMMKNEGEGGKLTLNELAAQCFVFFVAGFETSSSTACFVLYNLSTHLNIQDKLRNEIKTILAKSKGEITYEGMQEMKYLQMVIDETLRLHGPVAQLIRKASKDYKIAGSDLTVTEGTLIVVPVLSIHTDPDIYPDPEKFDPERFSDENKRDRHPMAHLPFGTGPHNCIGSRFGLMQTKIALIQLLTNFKFSPSAKTTNPMVFDPASIIMAPKNNMWLKVKAL